MGDSEREPINVNLLVQMLLEQQHDALNEIMVLASKPGQLDIKSARQALTEIYRIAKNCRNL